MRLALAVLLAAAPALAQLRGVATVSATDISDLGYPGTTVAYGLAAEHESAARFVELSADYSRARKADAPSAWSVTASGMTWQRLGVGTQFLFGGGLGYSRTDAGVYVTDAWRWRGGIGAYRSTGWGAWRATLGWLGTLRDEHHLCGLELGARAEFGHGAIRPRISGMAGGYEFSQPGRPGNVSARTYGGALGLVF